MEKNPTLRFESKLIFNIMFNVPLIWHWNSFWFTHQYISDQIKSNKTKTHPSFQSIESICIESIVLSISYLVSFIAIVKFLKSLRIFYWLWIQIPLNGRMKKSKCCLVSWKLYFYLSVGCCIWKVNSRFIYMTVKRRRRNYMTLPAALLKKTDFVSASYIQANEKFIILWTKMERYNSFFLILFTFYC